MEFPTQLKADTSTRAGRMLEAGDIRVTVTRLTDSPDATGTHITVRIRAFRDNREGERGKNWLRVPLPEATHVFIEVPNASAEWPDKVGTWYPRTGQFFPDKNADPERVEAAALAARWLNEGSQASEFIGQWHFQEEAYCGKCGLALTDPESIRRGIGPTCLGKETGSKHQVKQTVARGSQSVQVAGEEDEPWTAEAVLDLIAELSEEDQRHILRELKMWHSQGRHTVFEGR